MERDREGKLMLTSGLLTYMYMLYMGTHIPGPLHITHTHMCAHTLYKVKFKKGLGGEHFEDLLFYTSISKPQR